MAQTTNPLGLPGVNDPMPGDGDWTRKGNGTPTKNPNWSLHPSTMPLPHAGAGTPTNPRSALPSNPTPRGGNAPSSQPTKQLGEGPQRGSGTPYYETVKSFLSPYLNGTINSNPPGTTPITNPASVKNGDFATGSNLDGYTLSPGTVAKASGSSINPIVIVGGIVAIAALLFLGD
jgi:hypothetical protein